MIRGSFVGDRPFVTVEIVLRTEHLGIAIPMMVDTGADGTALSARDQQTLAWPIHPEPPRFVRSAGIGGIVDMPMEPVTLELRHEDGAVDAWEIELELLPRDPVSGIVPSFVGRDVLQHYRLYMSIAERELRLEVVP